MRGIRRWLLGRGQGDGKICPLATASGVERMMPWVMPALGDEGTGLVQTMSGRVPDTDPWSRPAPHARWFAPFGWRHRAVMLGDRYVTVRSGRFRRDVRVIDRTRLQAIQAIAGPVDRRLGLSNLYLYLPRGTAENTVAKHFSASLVEKLRDDLVLTSRPFR